MCVCHSISVESIWQQPCVLKVRLTGHKAINNCKHRVASRPEPSWVSELSRRQCNTDLPRTLNSLKLNIKGQQAMHSWEENTAGEREKTNGEVWVSMEEERDGGEKNRKEEWTVKWDLSMVDIPRLTSYEFLCCLATLPTSIYLSVFLAFVHYFSSISFSLFCFQSFHLWHLSQRRRGNLLHTNFWRQPALTWLMVGGNPWLVMKFTTRGSILMQGRLPACAHTPIQNTQI